MPVVMKNKSILVLAYGYGQSYSYRRGIDLFYELKKGNKVIVIYRRIKGLLGNAVEFVRYPLAALVRRPNIVYMIDIGGPPLLAAILAKLFTFGRTKVVLDTADLVYNAVKHEAKYPIVLEQIIEGIVWFLEKFSHKIADALIVPGTYHKEVLIKKGYKNVHYVPNTVDTSVFKPFSGNDVRKKLGFGDNLVVGVTGHTFWDFKLGTGLGSEIIDAVALLKDKPVRGLIVGGGLGLSHLKEYAKKKGVTDKIVFTGKVPHKKIPKYLNAMDVFMFTNPPAWLNSQIRTTSKFVEALATNKFILSSNTIEAMRFLQDNALIIKYQGFPDKQYGKKVAEKLRYILSHKAILSKGKKGRSIAVKNYESKVQRKRLGKVLEKIIS